MRDLLTLLSLGLLPCIPAASAVAAGSFETVGDTLVSAMMVRAHYGG